MILYIDDFEICNPLGTSRKKHKVTAVYWVLADIPATLRSTLCSIYLAILCKANNINKYGYPKVLEPLLKDLKCLEDDGIFVPSLGKVVNGTVFAVSADNLTPLVALLKAFLPHIFVAFALLSVHRSRSMK